MNNSLWTPPHLRSQKAAQNATVHDPAMDPPVPGEGFGAEEEWTNDIDSKLPELEDVGTPWADRVLILPLRPPEKIGNILLTDEYRYLETYMSFRGRIIGLGPCAYKGLKWQRMGLAEDQIPRRGEWWLIRQYQFERIAYKDLKLLICHEDSLLHRIPDHVNPWDYKIDR